MLAQVFPRAGRELGTGRARWHGRGNQLRRQECGNRAVRPREHQVGPECVVGGLDLRIAAAGDFRIRERGELVQALLQFQADRRDEDAADGILITGPGGTQQRIVVVQAETAGPRCAVALTDFERVELFVQAVECERRLGAVLRRRQFRQCAGRCLDRRAVGEARQHRAGDPASDERRRGPCRHGRQREANAAAVDLAAMVGDRLPDRALLRR